MKYTFQCRDYCSVYNTHGYFRTLMNHDYPSSAQFILKYRVLPLTKFSQTSQIAKLQNPDQVTSAHALLPDYFFQAFVGWNVYLLVLLSTGFVELCVSAGVGETSLLCFEAKQSASPMSGVLSKGNLKTKDDWGSVSGLMPPLSKKISLLYIPGVLWEPDSLIWDRYSVPPHGKLGFCILLLLYCTIRDKAG